MRHYHQVIASLAASVLFLVLFYALYVGDLAEGPPGGEAPPDDPPELQVWCIFARAGASPLGPKLRTMLESLLGRASAPLALNLLTDPPSRELAREALLAAVNATGKDLKVIYYDIKDAMKKMGNIVTAMKPHFTSQPGAYYSDSLFFISLVLHKIAPRSQTKVVMLDVDTKLQADIVDLFKEFDRFSSSAIIGAAHELSPVYRHVLYWWRGRHRTSPLGAAASSGGFPGLNSGVLLLHMDRLRASAIYSRLLRPESVSALTRKYSFKGHLGDQDFYTLVALDYPELFHILDCGWNRQLCTWWRDHGYHDIFDKFAKCESPVKLYHGNCNTPLPRI